MVCSPFVDKLKPGISDMWPVVWIGENEDKLKLKTQFRLLFISDITKSNDDLNYRDLCVCVSLSSVSLFWIFHNIDFLIKVYYGAEATFTSEVVWILKGRWFVEFISMASASDQCVSVAWILLRVHVQLNFSIWFIWI